VPQKILQGILSIIFLLGLGRPCNLLHRVDLPVLSALSPCRHSFYIRNPTWLHKCFLCYSRDRWTRIPFLGIHHHLVQVHLDILPREFQLGIFLEREKSREGIHPGRKYLTGSGKQPMLDSSTHGTSIHKRISPYFTLHVVVVVKIHRAGLPVQEIEVKTWVKCAGGFGHWSPTGIRIFMENPRSHQRSPTVFALSKNESTIINVPVALRGMQVSRIEIRKPPKM